MFGENVEQTSLRSVCWIFIARQLSAHDIDMTFLSVCPSVRRTLWHCV